MMFKKMISTAENIDFFYLILYILLIFLAYFGYLFFKKKVYEDLEKFLFHIKIVIYTLFTLFCLYLLISKTIEIQIREGDENSSVIWTIIIALLMGMYISTSFGSVGLSKHWLKYFSMFILAYVWFTGVGYFGFRIIFRFPQVVYYLLTGFWHNDIYQSNHPRGLFFLGENLPFFMIVYAISYTLEGEKGG